MLRLVTICRTPDCAPQRFVDEPLTLLHPVLSRLVTLHMLKSSMNWDDVRIFLSVAEHGSFRKAAIAANVRHTTLSRRIESLEDSVGAKLFTRGKRGLSLTEAGQEMFDTAVPVSRELDQLQVKIFGQEQSPVGGIKLTAPCMLINHLLLEPLVHFSEQWPDIHITIDQSLSVLDLSLKEADIALRLTDTPDEDLIGRQVGEYREAVYASRGYLERFKTEAWERHRWLFPGADYEFSMTLEPAYAASLPPDRVITLPDPDAQMSAAELGAGIATLPCLIADQRPGLIRISDVVRRSGIWLLCHPDARRNRRLQIFRDFLVRSFNLENERLLL